MKFHMLLLVVACTYSSAYADDRADLTKLCLEATNALSDCADVKCYREAVAQYGSKSAKDNLAAITDEKIQNLIDAHSTMRLLRDPNSAVEVTAYEKTDESVKITLGSAATKGWKGSCILRLEAGQWKLGK